MGVHLHIHSYFYGYHKVTHIKVTGGSGETQICLLWLKFLVAVQEIPATQNTASCKSTLGRKH